jgi:hypothetical protein
MDRIISIFGIFSIIIFFIGLGKLNYKKLNEKKKIKVILTRTSTEEIINPTPPSITFDKLFSLPSVWIGDFGLATKNKKFYRQKPKKKQATKKVTKKTTKKATKTKSSPNTSEKKKIKKIKKKLQKMKKSTTKSTTKSTKSSSPKTATKKKIKKIKKKLKKIAKGSTKTKSTKTTKS